MAAAEAGLRPAPRPRSIAASRPSSPIHPPPDHTLDLGLPPDAAALLDPAALDARLRRLGAQSEARRLLNVALPWTISVVGHLLAVALILILGWSSVRPPVADDPVLVVAELDEPVYAPVVDGPSGQGSTAADLVLPAAPPPSLPEPVPGPAPASPGAPAPPMPSAIDWAPPAGRDATFVGMRAGEVRRIAYVVDASGSMIGTLPIVLDELSRSMRALGPDQQFAVFFFQRNDAVAAPPGDRFVPATSEQIDRTLRWARQRIVPAGRSNPLRALEAALRLRPDAIFLLSTSITGSGQFEMDQGELLRRLDKANPADTSGRRRTTIHCIQFLDPDPLDTLERIASIHGGPAEDAASGPPRYRFLSRSELGVAPK